MRVMLAHTDYWQHGGEDVVVESLERDLAARGHEVTRLSFANAHGARAAGQLALSVSNPASVRRTREEVARWRPDVVHVHNLWFAGTPGVLGALVDAGVPTVATLHNYRAQCANFLCRRDGMPCTDCVGGSALPGLKHRCYRDSLVLTAIATRSARSRRGLSPRLTQIAGVQFLNPFMRDLLLPGIGVEASRAHVIGNYTAAGAPPAGGGRSGLLYLSRLTEEKGVGTLLEAWERIEAAGLLPGEWLRIAGDGPMEDDVRRAAQRCSRLEYLGRVPHADGAALLARSRAVALCSTWFEGQPMVIPEALAQGASLVLPRLGPMAELEDHGVAALFEPGDVASLTATIVRALSQEGRVDPAVARSLYEDRFSPEVVLPAIEQMYAAARERGNAASR